MAIRVLLVEDSPVALIILKRILAQCNDILVVGTARSGLEALSLIPQLQPDVICTDLHMPHMDGLEFTGEVMANFPKPILVISASVQAEDTYNVFQLLNAGAVDVFPKPKTGLASDYQQAGMELIHKIRVLAGVKVFTKHRRGATVKAASPAASPSSHLGSRVNSPVAVPTPQKTSFSSQIKTPQHRSQSVTRVVVIGASTGGPQALHTVLTQFSPKLPVPIICVQHISEGFLRGLVNWLDCQCSISVKIAQAGDLPERGNVYFAPEGKHLEIDRNGRFLYSSNPALGGHRPSITVTMKSVANFYGSHTLGVLLTGMGRDGADGMLEIAQWGGITIAQNEESCVVFGMPREAIALGAASHILPVEAIAPLILNMINSTIKS
ncbi:chemotaxis-specific protein-glutamate methyltransferase CheB [Arthrospira platensis]|jgi:two-component system chemotaxis response regulator CheB|nr:chemotaxis-specific protein-glutamate methyltransferase CheB [Arthrospira platensis]KDR55994.1 chemotaxis protein [Arthrospira platensis str. Paraca]MBD2669778.1 chemotaxis-specific protein-glutamate methyltransferase CheB [Arthrospira platensis FACHB-439]MBD2710361.1 chemotaxis-specific protein-glutamate methyltransferase CheB [Arthrospira platensis FACHB-835]MDF2212627.1 chemotaxis-specific protein-glutamate methyltransferase CheB [Arthrospira platensis NCB002]MDT9183004.1 chemotaxis-spec